MGGLLLLKKPFLRRAEIVIRRVFFSQLWKGKNPTTTPTLLYHDSLNENGRCNEHLQQVGPRGRVKQGSRAKDLLCACFCHLLLAADEDSRLKLGSLGSTSLLQFLPELLDTLTEDNKAGEDLPQLFTADCLWFSCPPSAGIVPPLLGIDWNTTGNCHLVYWELGETCWAAVLAAWCLLDRSPN